IPNYNDIVGYFGGMSVQIFRRSLWMGIPDKAQHIGTQTIHLFLLLTGFKQLPFRLIAKPLVKTRADNMRWNTFVGLETMRKRMAFTKKTNQWIFELYQIPYSKFRLNAFYVRKMLYQLVTQTIKKYVLRNEAVRNFVIGRGKKIIGQ